MDICLPSNVWHARSIVESALRTRNLDGQYPATAVPSTRHWQSGATDRGRAIRGCGHRPIVPNGDDVRPGWQAVRLELRLWVSAPQRPDPPGGPDSPPH